MGSGIDGLNTSLCFFNCGCSFFFICSTFGQERIRELGSARDDFTCISVQVFEMDI